MTIQELLTKLQEDGHILITNSNDFYMSKFLSSIGYALFDKVITPEEKRKLQEVK